MEKAFVTGGTGFIGSHLVEALLRRGLGEVRCLVRTRRKWLEGLPIREVRGDLFDEALVADAVRDVDYVYHNGGVTRARDDAVFQEANVEATLRLMETLARVNPGVRRVVVTSSLAVVGRSADPVATEESPMQPLSRYGASKARMEEALSAWRDRLPIVIVRPSTVYGPREADLYAFFRMANMGFCPVVGDTREPAMSLVHARDLVRGMIAAAETPGVAGETFFLGGEALYSWRDLKEAAAAALGRNALTVPVPPPLVSLSGALVEGVFRLWGSLPPFHREKAREIRYACKMCSIDKARRLLEYRPALSLKEGVADTIAWYRAQGWLPPAGRPRES